MKPLTDWQEKNLATLVKRHGLRNVMDSLWKIAWGQVQFWRGFGETSPSPLPAKKVPAWEEAAERIANANTLPWECDDES